MPRPLLPALLLFALAPPVAAQEGAFLRPDIATGSADVAIDRAGRLHAAYVRHAPDAEAPEAFYATCKGPAEACLDPAAWREVPLGALAREAQVDVTPEGAPRLLITSASRAQPGGLDHAFAACDGGCADPAAWTLTPLATSWDTTVSSITADDLPQRSFALDPEGRPRFLYSDRNHLVEPDHYGTFYMSCETGCADAASWTETDLARHVAWDTEIFDAPALAFTPDGRPRVAARIFGFDPAVESVEPMLYYLACEADCTASGSWRRVQVYEAGSGAYPSPTWDLAIDAQGRPRIALFTGSGLTDPTLDHALIYFWCDAADCLGADETSAEGWEGTVVAAGHGEAASLALDAEGRPRMAFLTAAGDVALGRCDAACEVAGGAWEVEMLEESAGWAQERPTALPFTCDGEVWEGLAPELALDPAGRALVAFDVAVEARCLYQERGEPEVAYSFHPLWRGARLAAR